MNYLVIAKYRSKYGLILYCTRVSNGSSASDVSLDNVFLYTFYIKSSFDPEVGSVCKLSYITSSDNKLYAFPEA